MHKQLRFLSAFCALWIATIGLATATMTDYQFTEGTGSAFDMAGASQAIGSNADETRATGLDIGFTFTFDGVGYTTFSVSSNGWLKLGAAATSADLSNAFDAGAQYPIITAFWDDLRTHENGGYVNYVVSGSAPNRVLTVEWITRYWSATTSGPWQYQVRLYESGKIEFYYESMPSNGGVSATIGAGTSNTNFISISPQAAGNPATYSYTTSDNSIDIDTRPIADGTLYTLASCESTVSLVGNSAEGGTDAMNDGDQLLVGQESVVGEDLDLSPFTLVNGLDNAGCDVRDYTFSIAGAFPGDYRISPAGGTVAPGESVVPVITFTPTGVGERSAVLTVTDNNGFVRNYALRGEGVPRIRWTGDVTQGGTAALQDGDRLLANVSIPRHTSQTFRPITLRNLGRNTSAAPAEITYTLIDPDNQYSINPTSTTLGAGGSSTPVITFAPTLTGEQTATLRVEADGEVRTFTLSAYSEAPSAEFSVNGVIRNPGGTLFTRTVLCIGNIESVPVTIRNTNKVNFVINDFDLFMTDNGINQGNPRYAILRDEFGTMVKATDYIVTDAPAQFPLSKNNAVSEPVVIAPGEARTFYLNYIPYRRGSRYARLVINTNGENFEGYTLNSFDQGATPTKAEGIFDIDLFGKALGAELSGNSEVNLPKPIVFDPIDVRTTLTMSTWVENTGNCDLRISADELRIMTGDVNDFRFISVFPNTAPTGQEYVFAPGQGDSITVSFTPLTFGSRRASIRLVTNDSSLTLPGVSERGTFYINLFGRGKVGIEARDISLSPAVVDAENGGGALHLENTSGGIAVINNVEILDAANEIIIDPSMPWPSFPMTLNPGDSKDLALLLKPATGAPAGPRQARIKVTFNGQDTVIATVTGYVGTRTLAASPNALFTTTNVGVGNLARGYVALTNTGSVPVRLNEPVISGQNAADYTMSPLARRVLQPGATEILEVTYSPIAVGTSSAQIDFTSNATNGMVTVMLGGEATAGNTPNGGGASQGISQPGTPGAELSRTGAESGTEALLALTSITPNPGRDVVTVEYRLAGGPEGTLALYNSRGILVRRIALPQTSNGNVQISVTDLESGTYRCLLEQNGVRVGTSLVVVH